MLMDEDEVGAANNEKEVEVKYGGGNIDTGTL
jgi:hypothetical protein